MRMGVQDVVSKLVNYKDALQVINWYILSSHKYFELLNSGCVGVWQAAQVSARWPIGDKKWQWEELGVLGAYDYDSLDEDDSQGGDEDVSDPCDASDPGDASDVENAEDTENAEGFRTTMPRSPMEPSLVMPWLHPLILLGLALLRKLRSRVKAHHRGPRFLVGLSRHCLEPRPSSLWPLASPARRQAHEHPRTQRCPLRGSRPSALSNTSFKCTTGCWE